MKGRNKTLLQLSSLARCVVPPAIHECMGCALPYAATLEVFLLSSKPPSMNKKQKRVHDIIVRFMAAYIAAGKSSDEASSLAIDAWRVSNNALEYVFTPHEE